MGAWVVHDLVRQAERDIDASFAASALVEAGYTQAIWTLLSMNEDYFFKTLHQGSEDHELHVFADMHINTLTYPLRVCFEKAPNGNNGLRDILIDEHYKLAWDWIEAAKDYSQFCSLFPLWHRGKIGVTIAENRLIVDHRADRKHEYEAYNRLIRKEGTPEVIVPPLRKDLSDLIFAAPKIEADSFRVNFNPGLVSALVAWLSPVIESTHTLPQDWEFNGFTLRDYHKVFVTLQIDALRLAICQKCRGQCWNAGDGIPVVRVGCFKRGVCRALETVHGS
jgi:hypothetical protein